LKKLKYVVVILLVFTMLMNTVTVFADDNADTGSGGTEDALAGKGFYRTSEYMYKVSIYVGLSDRANESDSLLSNWRRIGSQPLYVKPASFTLPAGTFFGSSSKVDYMNGASLSSNTNPLIITDNPPPIPITNNGNITAVKSYFGDTATLNNFIEAYAYRAGTSKQALVSSINFTIDGDTKQYPPEDILPTKSDGVYQNKVPWLIIYEPVIITYLKDRATVLAFTATEYALAQKLGYFNFKGGSDGQYVSGMTHSDLPNSIFLEESWFGFPVTSALADGVLWGDDRIINGGGWGMRMLRPARRSLVVSASLTQTRAASTVCSVNFAILAIGCLHLFQNSEI